MAGMVCPWWLGYLLACPLRRWLHDPEAILRPYVKAGDAALDLGCAMGYFTMPLARAVGPAGSVVAVDLQEKMLRTLRKRAAKNGLADRITARRCGVAGLGIEDLAGRIDFALAFAVVHEVPDPTSFFSQVRLALAEGGRLLVAEPRGHVREAAFEGTIQAATATGLRLLDRPPIPRSRTALFQK